MPALLPQSEIQAMRQAIADDDRGETTRFDIAITDSIQAELGTYTPSVTDLAKLSEARRNWWLCARFEAESNHGGVEYYLCDSPDGEFASQASAALRAFGADQLAEILDEAIAVVPAHIRSSDLDARSEWCMDHGSGLFDDVNERFYQIGTSEIERLSYAVDHPAEFFQQ